MKGVEEMGKNIDKDRQNKTVLFDALKNHLSNRVVRFDVPGHKGGRGNKEFRDFIGLEAMQMDVNSMKPLDNLCHPTSVIKEAQEIAAEAFGAKEAYFMVSGTTGAVQAMIMATCKAGDKIIIPRNVHRSAINAMVICGAIPVYINPGLNKKLGISLGMSINDVKKAISENPDAKAILVNNPTYYGICSDLKSIVKLAHEHNMLVLVDEAHGAHFYFGDNLPISAMAAGADMAAISMHKTGGSLTQSSILLSGERINADYVRQVINLTQTTSASYLLMTSLDTARKNMSINGKEIFKKTVEFAEYAREEINKLGAAEDAELQKLMQEQDKKVAEFQAQNEKRQAEERGKLLDSIQTATNNYAKANGYSYVLDANSVVFAVEGKDISDAVLKTIPATQKTEEKK